MTSKLTITDERVISVIERLEHYACNLKWTNVRGAQDLLTAADGLRELQERRKAAMDSEPAMESEPVAIENFRSAMEGIGHIRRTLEETFGGLHGTHVEPDVLAECKAICDAIYAAYGHAQPAPVVMDDRKLRSLFDSWFASDCSFDLSPEASEADNIAWRESYWYVWQRCRAAMLQAGTLTNEGTKQAGNSPVIPCAEQRIADAVELLKQAAPAMLADNGGPNGPLVGRLKSPAIPDGYRLQPISEYEAMCATVNSDEWPQRWIPVSERMPEDRTQVILWDAEIGEVTSGHYSHKTHTFYHCGDAIQNEITHWMPLPAAPQEVK
ncbi:DUF551 domain-containing protein [Raoultella ornithinolytica]|uniref:DUF551 domain-containing protein n=1 Tax=Raoultella ornithinolytica TaxID=54291 RepID=UPI00024FC02C|nr:DUF551 domain-containing protein [Raoultella ornithinolytica]EHT08332.1 hypothetical protein HMPREF9690_03062 [Raoultella ornithinolytica 10-5246]HCB1275752.1 DUF551 domain-containing protein [Klebsiella pneumoniae]